LTELMDKEAEMVQHIKSLDSDMQTLVYENYNKFISATDTIRTVCHLCIIYHSFPQAAEFKAKLGICPIPLDFYIFIKFCRN